MKARLKMEMAAAEILYSRKKATKSIGTMSLVAFASLCSSGIYQIGMLSF